MQDECFSSCLACVCFLFLLFFVFVYVFRLFSNGLSCSINNCDNPCTYNDINSRKIENWLPSDKYFEWRLFNSHCIFSRLCINTQSA